MSTKSEEKKPSAQNKSQEQKVEIEYITEKKKPSSQGQEQETHLKNKLKKKEAEIKHLKKEMAKLKLVRFSSSPSFFKRFLVKKREDLISSWLILK